MEKDADALLAMVRLTDVPCSETSGDNMDSLPKCPAGTSSGTKVPVIYELSCNARYISSAELLRRVMDNVVNMDPHLFAVYEDRPLYYDADAYVLAFASPSEVTYPEALYVSRDGEIVMLRSACGFDPMRLISADTPFILAPLDQK